MKACLPALILCFLLHSCAGKKEPSPGEINTIDSNTIPIPSYSNVPVDTDDHNRGTESEIALDSPLGPHDLSDTLKTAR
jgi:hypothetical protein